MRTGLGNMRQAWPAGPGCAKVLHDPRFCTGRVLGRAQLSRAIVGRLVNGVDRVASEVGKGVGKKWTRRTRTETLRSINRTVGRTVVTKYGTVRGVMALGNVLPFGVGACIGAGGNYLTVGAIAFEANRFFSQLPGDLDDDPAAAAMAGWYPPAPQSRHSAHD